MQITFKAKNKNYKIGIVIPSLINEVSNSKTCHLEDITIDT